MDVALATGIDGWKCDGTDPYIMELIEAHGHVGVVTPRYCDRKVYVEQGEWVNYNSKRVYRI